MRDAIFDALDHDVTLTAILTGGVHTATEISRQLTPGAFDANSEIKPCALLKFSSLVPRLPYAHGARLTFSIMFYERAGYDSIETARARVYELLHTQKVSPAEGACWEIRHADDVLDQRDNVLDCSLAASRYSATIRRA